MYYGNMLARHSKESVGFLNSVASSGSSRSKAFEVAMAFSVARMLALPTEPVESPAHYYRLTHDIETSTIFGEINEIIPFNTKEVREYTIAFYKYRYEQMNPIAIPLALVKGQEITDFFGLNRCFSNEVLEAIKTDGARITQFCNGLFKVLSEITEYRAKMAASSAPPQEAKDVFVAQ